MVLGKGIDVAQKHTVQSIRPIKYIHHVTNSSIKLFFSMSKFGCKKFRLCRKSYLGKKFSFNVTFFLLSSWYLTKKIISCLILQKSSMKAIVSDHQTIVCYDEGFHSSISCGVCFHWLLTTYKTPSVLKSFFQVFINGVSLFW